MRKNIQSINFNADSKLIDFAEKRLDKLSTFFTNISSVDVYLKVENTSEKENKIVEIKAKVPGDNLIVKKQCRTFEEGIDNSCSSFERTLIKYKEKRHAK